MTTLEHKGLTAEVDIDPENSLLRGRITQTGTVFHAKYNHVLKSRFKMIVDNMWFGEMSSEERH